MQCIVDMFWGHGGEVLANFSGVLEVLWEHFGGMLGPKGGSGREHNSDVQKGTPHEAPKDVQDAVIGGQK